MVRWLEFLTTEFRPFLFFRSSLGKKCYGQQSRSSSFLCAARLDFCWFCFYQKISACGWSFSLKSREQLSCKSLVRRGYYHQSSIARLYRTKSFQLLRTWMLFWYVAAFFPSHSILPFFFVSTDSSVWDHVVGFCGSILLDESHLSIQPRWAVQNVNYFTIICIHPRPGICTCTIPSGEL